MYNITEYSTILILDSASHVQASRETLKKNLLKKDAQTRNVLKYFNIVGSQVEW